MSHETWIVFIKALVCVVAAMLILGFVVDAIVEDRPLWRKLSAFLLLAAVFAGEITMLYLGRLLF